MSTLVEMCAGGGSVTLAAVAGRPHSPLTAYLGGKARFACGILAALDVRRRPERVVLCDAGPWGKAWQVLAGQGQWAEVADHLRALDRAQHKGAALFMDIAQAQPPTDRGLWAAHFLALQSANARGRPVQSLADRWRTHGYAHLSTASVAKGFTDRLRPGLLAARVEEMGRLPWPAVQVYHGRAETVPVEVGAWVYIDPPYLGTTSYGVDFAAEDVQATAERWRAAGCRVAVSEGRPMAWDGWQAMRLTPDRPWSRLGHTEEWLTLSTTPAGQTTLALEATT